MNKYLCISATFLADRYHGQEWPPDPARLFQALLAGARTGSYQNSCIAWSSVLSELETLPPPEMLAAPAERRYRYRIAVPNNDSDEAGREWRAGRDFDAGSLRTLKTVAPREVCPSGAEAPHVYYIWPLMNADVDPRDVAQVAHCLHTFGWGIDMAYADSFVLNDEQKKKLVSDSGYRHYQPGGQGKLSKVPASGYLKDLTEAYERACNRQTARGIDPSTRALAYGQEYYSVVAQTGTATAQFSLRRLDDEDKNYAVPWALGMQVAAWMRHAAAEALRDEGYPDNFVNSYVLGHGNGHERHMSFVPVPTVHAKHPDGAIRRVMLVEPSDSDGSVARLLQERLAPSVLRKLVEGGGPQPVCSLTEAPNDSVMKRYKATALEWQTVTPMVLHGHNSEHGKFSLKKTEQLLYQAFEKAGYSRRSIAEVFFQPAPFWQGTEGAKTMRVPAHLDRFPRYHVAVKFNEPVRGPVLAGIGRHYGVGLFAAKARG
jgi:CRISPR-associated protein Csb2